MYVNLSFGIQNISRPSSIGHVGGLLHLVNRVVFRYVVIFPMIIKISVNIK